VACALNYVSWKFLVLEFVLTVENIARIVTSDIETSSLPVAYIAGPLMLSLRYRNTVTLHGS
jgi:hypothetical protein